MEPDLTIVLLGKTGVGKSASGNTILGRNAFESRFSFKSVTTQCSEATENVCGKQITVVDTPGILGAEEDIKTRCQEVKTRCQEVLDSSRPCLFLVVVKADRFTPEEQQAVEAVTDILGARGLEKSYLLFTRGDNLRNMTLKDFIFEVEGALPDVITRSFAGKYHVFNNEDGGPEQIQELLVKSGHLTTNIPTDSVRPEDRRIVLIGRPGVGKSASGNTILGSDVFGANCDFGAVTTKSEAKSEMVDGCRVTVMDTPGFSDKVLSPRRLFKEIMKMLIECCPGPHAFIFVVQIGRISKHDAKLFSLLPKLFNSDALKYSMVLFTHGDRLGNQSFEEKIQGSRCLSELVEKCGGRYCVFDNSRKGNRLQVRELLDKIDNMITANGGECYSSEMFKTAYTFWREAQNKASFDKARDSLGEADKPNSNPNPPVPYRGQAQSPLCNPNSNPPVPYRGQANPKPDPNSPKQTVWEDLMRFLASLWEDIKAYFKLLLIC